MKRLTAVQWLIKELKIQGMDATIAQAMKMERKQMLAYTKYRKVLGPLTEDYYTEDFNKFYDNTYPHQQQHGDDQAD